MNHADFPGYKLTEQREALGLSLLDAYHETHVPIEYLTRLEKGELDELPATAYTKGFLATYCNVLQLPAEPFLEALHACRATQPDPSFLNRGSQTGTNTPYPLWVRDAMTWAAICGLLLLGWISYSFVVKPFGDAKPDRVDAGTIEIAPPARFEAE